MTACSLRQWLDSSLDALREMYGDVPGIFTTTRAMLLAHPSARLDLPNDVGAAEALQARCDPEDADAFLARMHVDLILGSPIEVMPWRTFLKAHPAQAYLGFEYCEFVLYTCGADYTPNFRRVLDETVEGPAG